MQPEIELLPGFIPHKGSVLEARCCTSYGMDPRILLAIVGCTLEAGENDIETSTLTSAGKGKLVASLMENLPKVLFIREKGLNFAGDRKNNSTFENLICDNVIGRWCRTKGRGSQHAKIILAIYKNDSGERYGRLYVGSKNLTAGLCREIGVVLDLVPKGARKNPGFLKDLVAFLQKALKPELEGASPRKMKVFEKVVESLKGAELAPADPNLAFHWQSRHGKTPPLISHLTKLAESAKRIDIHSPWADPTVIERLVLNAPKAPIHLRCLKDPRYAYNMRPRVIVRFDGITRPSERLKPHQSHAKAYLFSGKSSQTLLFGSANFTASGLGLSDTPNTEVLVAWPTKSNQFRELLQSGEGADLDDEKKKKSGLTPQEKLQQEMFEIEIELDYSPAKGELIYFFRNPPKTKMTVSHLLLEPFSDKGEKEYKVVEGTPLPTMVTYKLDAALLKKVSSRIIFSAQCQGIEVEADFTVDLPLAFYEARSNLRDLAAFRLLRDQLIQELLDLADFPTGGVGGGGIDGRAPEGLDQWLKWLEKVHLERLLLRLFRMQARDPKLFEQRNKRLKIVIEDLKKSDEEKLKELGMTLEGLTDVFKK